MFKIGDEVKVKSTEQAILDGVPRKEVVSEGVIEDIWDKKQAWFKIKNWWYYITNLELTKPPMQKYLFCYMANNGNLIQTNTYIELEKLTLSSIINVIQQLTDDYQLKDVVITNIIKLDE